jgi:hypothetical protein
MTYKRLTVVILLATRARGFCSFLAGNPETSET